MTIMKWLEVKTKLKKVSLMSPGIRLGLTAMESEIATIAFQDSFNDRLEQHIFSVLMN